MFIQVRRPVPELSNQSMTVFVDQRRLLHIGWIAGSQVHRKIANARATRSFEDNGLDVRLEERQSRTSLHRLDDLRSLVGPQAPVRFCGLRECPVLRSEGHADLSLCEKIDTRWRRGAAVAARDNATDHNAPEQAQTCHCSSKCPALSPPDLIAVDYLTRSTAI